MGRAWTRGVARATWGVWVSAERLPSAVALVAHVVGQLAPRGAVGVRSAAAMHGLLEAPDVLDVVVPRTHSRSIASWPFAHRCFVVTSRAGDDQHVCLPVEQDLFLTLTARYRTVVDLVRFRSTVGELTASLALRRILDAGGELALLEHLARGHRASTGLARLLPIARALPPPPPVLDCRPLVFAAGHPERVPPFTR